MSIIEWLKGLTDSAWLVTLLISCVPVLELRGAIPVGVSLGMTPLAAMGVSIVGNMIPVPFILLFVRRLFSFLRVHLPWLGGFVSRLEARAEKHTDTVLRWKFWGLVILVAIPLPGTGAWTGALVAALMDLRLKKALPAISLGVVIAGVIVMVITYGVKSLVAG